MINIFQPALGAEEAEAVRAVFESNWVGRGQVTAQFEAEFAGHVGVPISNVRSVSTCTEALFQSMPLLGIGPGDEVILPAPIHVSAANAIAACGARPVFCDVDSRTLNTAAADIAKKITSKTRAVIVLHYGGVPCDMGEIVQLVEEKHLSLIEDSACSIASSIEGKACGTLGDIGVWSFDAGKPLVTGDGGMIYCRDPELCERFEELIHYGVSPATPLSNPAKTRWWEFELSVIGRRARMNDITAAIGRVQLQKLAASITRRREVDQHYSRTLAGEDWLQLPPPIPDHKTSSHYLYWIQTEERLRDQLAVYLRGRGIYTTFYYYPLHWVRFYGSGAHLPGADRAGRRTLCLPIHQSLSDEHLDRITQAILDFGQET